MRTRLMIEASEYDRYVVAQYFNAASTRKRTRATRQQVKQFAASAFATYVKEQVTGLSGRARRRAERLRQSTEVQLDLLERPAEQQPGLSW